jgi:type II secretion system protein H
VRVALRSRQSAFTLIEVLVVVAIIAAASAMLVLVASPSDATRARTEARRLATLLELAIAEARAGGQSIAWAPVPEGYAFYRRAEDSEWKEFEADSAYRRRALPEGVTLRDVAVESRPLREGERVVMTPYGLAGTIVATIAASNTSFTLRGGPLGRVSLVPAEAREDARTETERPRLHAG